MPQSGFTVLSGMGAENTAVLAACCAVWPWRFLSTMPESTVTRTWGITPSSLDRHPGRVACREPRDPRTVFSIVATRSALNIQRFDRRPRDLDTVESARASCGATRFSFDPANSDYVYVTLNDALSRACSSAWGGDGGRPGARTTCRRS